MLPSDPLPNDLLRHAPWTETIPTWPINDQLLTVIEHCEQKLDALGFHLKFGIEANLGILTPEEALKKSNDRRDASFFWPAPTRAQFKDALSRFNGKSWSRSPLDDLYRQCGDLAERRKTRAHSSTHPALNQWFENWEKTKAFYQTALRLINTPRQALAQKDFVIAAVHLLPPSMGGVEGMVEQRFESAHYGIGWWDGQSILESRTLPQRGHQSAISNYHHVLWKFKQALEYCGLVPITSVAMAQVHFSLWRNDDNTNIFLAEDDQAVRLQNSFLSTLRETLMLQPLAVGIDGRFSRPDQSLIGSDRTNTIRICQNGHWELRIPETMGVTHLARSLSHITQAAYTAAAPDTAVSGADNFEKLSKEFEGIPDAPKICSARDLVEPHLDEGSPIRRIIKMSIVSDRARISCPFESALKSATLDSDGIIRVSKELLDYNMPMMLAYIKHSSSSLYSVIENAEVHDLTSPVAWQALFASLRRREDGSFSTSHLHPILSRCFDGLRVEKLFTSFDGGALTRPQIISRDFANVRTSLLIAGGHGSLHGFDEVAEAMRIIHEFAANSKLTCRPESATSFLVRQYHSLATAAPSKSAWSAVDAVAFNVVDSAMGWGFEFLNSNDTSLFKPELAMFQEQHVVHQMIEQRRFLHAALPEASRFDMPRSKGFFESMTSVLADPLRLYSPERVCAVLTTRTVWGLDAIQVFIRNIYVGNIDPSLLRTGEDFNYAYFHKLGKSAGGRAMRIALAVHDDEMLPQALGAFEQKMAKMYREHKLTFGTSEDIPASVAETFAAAKAGMQEGIESSLMALRADLTPVRRLHDRALQLGKG